MKTLIIILFVLFASFLSVETYRPTIITSIILYLEDVLRRLEEKIEKMERDKSRHS